MKTLTDLLILIAQQTELNKGMLIQYKFDINTHYNWVSMYSYIEVGESPKLEQKFMNKSIKTSEQLQEVYWTIYNNSRIKK